MDLKDLVIYEAIYAYLFIYLSIYLFNLRVSILLKNLSKY